MKRHRFIPALALVAVLPMTAVAASAHFPPESVGTVEQRAYQDVRIGDPRLAAQSVDLDFHRGTGNFFAAVSWADGWSLNISTDGGATWQETYFYPSASEISMKVGGDFAWVSYASSTTPTQLRMRRFSAETGASDSIYHYQLVGNIHPATIIDVAMTSSADDNDSAVYVACIGSDNAAYFFWDDLVGTSFDSVHPPITNAEACLDITYNPDSSSGFFLFMSFEGMGWLQVWRLHFFVGWDHPLTSVVNGNNNYTAISAYQDTIVTMIEMDNTYGNGILQFVNTNSGQGGEWSAEIVYYPYSSSTPEAAGPDVSLRSPFGSMLTYQLEEGAFDGVYYRQRQGHGLGSLSNAVSINDVDSAAQEQTTVEWLGAGCGGTYGVVYLSGGDFVPYFDLVTPWAIFCDGFESGNTSAWN